MLDELHQYNELDTSFRRGNETDSVSGVKNLQIDSNTQRFIRFVGLLMLFVRENHFTKTEQTMDLIDHPMTTRTPDVSFDGHVCVTTIRHHEIIHERGDRYDAKERCHGCEGLGDSVRSIAETPELRKHTI